jgi:TRAP-type C4-dicarboxylate transport system substrate-binding protein
MARAGSGPIHFLRRIPPALEWRSKKAWGLLINSSARRVTSATAVQAARSVRRPRPLTLRFANALGAPLAELEWFAEEVRELSGGDVRVQFLNHWTPTTNPREETTTVEGTMRGRADLCWAGTRAFGCLGVRALDPLQAPLLIADYASVDAVCRDEVTTDMLEPLEELDLMGLCVLPGALRKPFAFTRRLIDPRDYEGTKLRIHESVVADATYRALGAQAVLLSTSEMVEEPEARVDGMDIQVAAIVSWGYKGSVTYNVNLWPRTLAIAASRKTFLWLGAPERKLLLDAARRTLTRALDELQDRERLDREELPAGVNVVVASDDQLRRLRERVEPVYENLRADPATRPGLERIEAIVARAATA